MCNGLNDIRRWMKQASRDQEFILDVLHERVLFPLL